jgi:hypothetical protein
MSPSRLTLADLLATLAERVDDLSLQGSWPEWSATLRARAARLRETIAFYSAPTTFAHPQALEALTRLNAPDEQPAVGRHDHARGICDEATCAECAPPPTPGPTRSTQRANRELQATDDRDVYDGGIPGPAKS